MNRIICLLCTLVLIFCGCTQSERTENTAVLANNENGDSINVSGSEYIHLANEGKLYYLGELDFVCGIQGEDETSEHGGMQYQTGMFAVKNASNDNILVRHAPNNEWFSIYRKASLPSFDFSIDNCNRLELVFGGTLAENGGEHVLCNGGISDKAEIATFLSEIRAQDDPRKAGLYDMIKKPDGMLENCYVYGEIYGFFEEEPNLAIKMQITSFNDLAYSVSIGDDEYVLPESWLNKLENAKCTH